jgi:hypothetical protein
MSDYIDIDDANKPSDWYMDLDIKYDDREAAKAISPLGLGWDNPNRTWYLRSGYANDLPALLDLIQEKKLSPTKKSPDNKPASGSSTKSNGQLVAKVKSWNTVKATDKTVQRMITKIAQEIFEQDPTFTVQRALSTPKQEQHSTSTSPRLLLPTSTSFLVLLTRQMQKPSSLRSSLPQFRAGCRRCSKRRNLLQSL